MKYQHLPSSLVLAATTVISISTLIQSKTEAASIGTIKPKRTPTSLVFVDAGDIRIPGYDHVALAIDDQLYESIYTGVTDKDRKLSGVSGITSILPLNRDTANQLKNQITTKVGSGYQELNLLTILPQYQKGLDGKFTCVGLIEWAAEAAGLNFYQGYILGINEYINIGEGYIPTLTPSLLYWSNIFLAFAHDAVLHMLLDPADFILTDPLGRRFGYTQELGLVQEIPNVFYTGDNWAEQLALANLLDGEYTLEVFVLDDTATVAFGNGNGGDYFSGYLAKSESKILRFNNSKTSSVSTPEPSLLLGLTALFFLGSLLKKRHRLN